MIKTDVLIIGAGPVGLFAVFEAGLSKLKCHLIDAIPLAGGQLSEIYPKKPIYDIPGFPSVLAGDLVNNLLEQAAPFSPGFTLGERADTIEKQEDGSFIVTTDHGTQHQAAVIFIAGGLGSFEPRRPLIDNLSQYEKKGVYYMVKEPAHFLDQDLIISGGGDSALDWAVYFAGKNKKTTTLVHRSDKFRAHKDSLDKVYALKKEGKLTLITHGEVKALHGNETLQNVSVAVSGAQTQVLTAQIWLPLFGLSPKLGPIDNWGLEIEKNAIVVNTKDYSTNIPGIYAIGDVNTYDGKLKLILCGFHEATLAVQSAYTIVNPQKKFNMKYTTVQGIQGFENTSKIPELV